MDYIGVDGEHVGIAVQDCWELVGETESGDLDKASKDILKDFGAIATTDKGLRLYSEDSMLGICKAGANWQMRQMMKDAKDATVIMTHVTNESLSPALSVVLLPDTFQEGDKVKVIIAPPEINLTNFKQ